jgi:hypothetical protein
MPLFVFLLLASAQAVAGPITDCPVLVDVVDAAWTPLPGIDVTILDERTGLKQTKITDESGTVKFSVKSCPDARCRFTVSGGRDSGFKAVKIKHLWFGEHQNQDRRVQIRLNRMKGPTFKIT